MGTQAKTVYAFIDSQNLNLGTQNLGWNLDFGKFYRYLKDKYKVEKAYLFIGHIAGNEKLYTYLQECGYILVFKPTLEFKKEGKVLTKGNVDAELVLHAMHTIEEYSSAIIVSGDGDFYCLIEYLAAKNKLKKIIVPSNKYSSLIRKFANKVLQVSLIKSKVENKRKRGIR